MIGDKDTTTSRLLTEAQIARINAIGGEPDTVDIPPAPEQNWAAAVRGKFYRPRKQTIKALIDADVLDWLRRQGPGYQTTINRILRERMETERPKA
jgi:uncharacterized protein (DUF4415 family)